MAIGPNGSRPNDNQTKWQLDELTIDHMAIGPTGYQTKWLLDQMAIRRNGYWTNWLLDETAIGPSDYRRNEDGPNDIRRNDVGPNGHWTKWHWTKWQ